MCGAFLLRTQAEEAWQVWSEEEEGAGAQQDLREEETWRAAVTCPG